MAARTVWSLRVLCALVVLACLAAAAVAPQAIADGSDTTGTGPFGPFAGYSLDPLAPSQPDDVPTYKQPDWLQDPLFNTYFGSGMFDPASGKYVSVAIGPDAATGASRVYVASSTTKLLYVFNGQMPLSPPTPPQPLFTFGTQPGPGTLQGPAGIAYYRGELYVVDRYLANPGQDRVVVYDTAGNYEREFPLLNPRGLFNMTGVDVMGDEVWVTGDLCGGLGGVVEIFDATTGALKAILPHFGNDPIPDATQPCDASADPSSWWDISAVPEMNSAIAQYRLINRGLLAQLSLPDAELACPNCFNGLFEDGTGEVPGMRWFLAVDGDSASRGTHVSEYAIDSDPTSGEPFLRVRRRWSPMQATTGGVRDVAYQRRDTRIDWTGNLTQPDWQHNDASGHQCLQYVVSDGDIFTVGAKGEHSWDLANVQKIEFYLDGTLQATIANQAAGTYCLDESVPPSGIHDLMAKAYVDNGDTVVSADDPNLHIDHDPPSGAVDGLPAYVRAATAIAGSMSDAHSGRRDWQAQISPSGQNSWSNANGCSLQSTPDPASGKYGCSLQTTGYADGRYDIRAMMRDNVQDPFGGPNAAATPSVSTYIDNTPPVIRLSGELWDRRDLQTIWFDDSPQLSVSATDPGSGVKNVEILVDGARSDFVEQGCGQGGCGLDHTYTFNPSVYPSSGDHTITVNSTDQLGQSSSTSWTVHVEAQSEADMPSPAPLDAPPSDQPVGPPKPEDTAAAPPDGDYGNGSLDDYCTSDPDTPSTDCSATVYDPTPDDPTSGSATTESPDSSVGGLPDLGSNSVAAAGPSIYLQPGHSGWGVSDQTGSTFSDSRFTALGVTKVRLIVAYDLVPQAQADPGAVQKVDGWIDAATQAGKRILVSFGHSWVAPGHIPSVKEYSHAVRQFRARYPGVKEFTPWNEPDYPGDPLAGHGYRAGQLWRNLNYQCQSAGCTVAAGDFLDKYFTADYLTNYLNGAGHLPPRWAWHAYQDGHQRTTVKLNRFLKATTYKNHSAPGVWLTEQGGRVGDYGVTTANADLAYMLTLPNVSSRIRRFYVYQWKGDGSWDSGLIDYNPPYATRPLYNTYKAKTSP